MANVDPLTRAASKKLAGRGIELDPTFPPEVDDGVRWGVLRIPNGATSLALLVGVPADGRFSADALVAGVMEGLEDFAELGPDEELEIGDFLFEIY